MMGAPLSSLPPHLQAKVLDQIGQQRRTAKYRAVRTEHDGVVYDSKAEARRAAELDAMTAAGQIIGYQRQVTFRLGDKLDPYRVDFLVFDHYGAVHAEDVKGYETKQFKHHLRRWRRFGPCDLWIVGKETAVVSGGPFPRRRENG
jgi:hypothetical protein